MFSKRVYSRVSICGIERGVRLQGYSMHINCLLASEGLYGTIQMNGIIATWNKLHWIWQSGSVLWVNLVT